MRAAEASSLHRLEHVGRPVENTATFEAYRAGALANLHHGPAPASEDPSNANRQRRERLSREPDAITRLHGGEQSALNPAAMSASTRAEACDWTFATLGPKTLSFARRGWPFFVPW